MSLWDESGALANAGVLIHVFDGWEAGPDQRWMPTSNGPGATQMSSSLIFGEMRNTGKALRDAVFTGAQGTRGLIFRPSATKLLCGKASDSSGSCLGYCRGRTRLSVPWNEAYDKFCTWRVKDFGVELHRLGDYQQRHRRLWYNEIIIDAAHWRNHLPNVIEAIYGDRDMHTAFLEHYGVTPMTHPYVELDLNNWDAPFS